MKMIQRGFTLIELVVVIVILGIMAAVALPKFIDISSEAGTAATQGVAGALASATAVNYAAKSVGAAATTLNGDNAATCVHGVLGPFLTGITLATAAGASANANTYNVQGGAGSCVGAPGTAITCALQGFKGNAYNATVICTGP